MWLLTFGPFTRGILAEFSHSIALILSSFFRHFPSGRQLQYYEHWAELNMQRSPQCHSISNGLIKSLLQVLFDSMPVMLQKNIVNQLRGTEYGIIRAIGWKQIAECDPSTSRNLLQSMNNDVSKLLVQLTTCKDAQSYYQLVWIYYSLDSTFFSTRYTNHSQSHCLACISEGNRFAELTIDRILTSKLEELLANCRIEDHVELLTAITEYVSCSKQQYTIADADNCSTILASASRLKYVKAVLTQSNDRTFDRLHTPLLNEYLQRYRQTESPFEKMFILRAMCQLHSLKNNKKMEIGNCIKSIEQELRSNSVDRYDQSSEGQYLNRITDNILLHQCANPTAQNGIELISKNEFRQTLDAMEIHAKKLSQMYQCNFHQDIDIDLYSNQVDRIINCLKLFRKWNQTSKLVSSSCGLKTGWARPRETLLDRDKSFRKANAQNDLSPQAFLSNTIQSSII